MADGMMGLDTSSLFGPSVMGGDFGMVPDYSVSPVTDASGLSWMFNGPSNSVFGGGTPAIDFLGSLPTETGGSFDMSSLGPGFWQSLATGAGNAISGLGSGIYNGLTGLLPNKNQSGSIIPGAMALTYAAAQPNLDLGQLNAISGQLAGNQNALIKAATDPLQQNIAAGYGDLLQSQALRGIRGSSFGDTDIANYLSTTGNTLANAGANAAQGSLALQSDLATNIAQLQNQRQQIKNSLYGQAFDVLGRGLNPQGYGNSINIGGGGGGAVPVSTSGSQASALGTLAGGGLGFALGGPVGGLLGAGLGGTAGKLLGGLF